MSGEHRRDATFPMAACGLSCTVALWTAGRWTPPPVAMGLLLAAALALGSALAFRPRRRAARALAGWACLVGCAAFLAVLFLAPAGVLVTRRGAAGDPPAVGAAQDLRLVNFNVLHGYPGFRDQESRYRRLASALRALDPTVVVLQEAWWTHRYGQLAGRLGTELDMDVAYARANGSLRLIGFEEGSAVLSRLPILDARRVVLWPRRPPWETRVALLVDLALGSSGFTKPGAEGDRVEDSRLGDSRLTVVGTHLGSTPERAAAQSRALTAWLDEAGVLERGRVGSLPLIVAGDFNAGSDSAAARAFTARGLRDLVPGGIDHVFVDLPASWRLVEARWTLRPQDLPAFLGDASAGKDAPPLSDHPGIVVELRRAGGGSDRLESSLDGRRATGEK